MKLPVSQAIDVMCLQCFVSVISRGTECVRAHVFVVGCVSKCGHSLPKVKYE